MSNDNTVQVNKPETLASILEYLQQESIFSAEDKCSQDEILKDCPQFFVNDPSKKLNWQQLAECFEDVFTKYTAETCELKEQIEELVQKRKTLFESYEKLDQERAKARIEKSLSWIITKEDNLSKFKSEVNTLLQTTDSEDKPARDKVT
ncbi:hypothetical protein MG5_00845 [Candida albicans P57072]|uniref:Uncharacterized protein n=3 Tax=Candida albicans TaxID=5476 RepID=A0A1D8PEJ1_CANAL|nr:uncharacterized protein CAALFM_C108830CA [Candida albicans SC5314]KAF6062827.1 hypothetical protein FOB64_005870 [Candida albicans]KGQ97870.1 hypothetical protein MEU_00853 [Candida albicans P37005]KGR14110.1 hypothetical protein MG5_00845 [Candida albicans P57072]KGR16988.1 hypothetical protein MG3_00897 [Candida albicans P78048]KGR22518.1 hypothetical protein MG9_00851 [Candida albicans P37037]KGT71340.1 hypothetical protein MEK_00883 [Candida albicans 12C]KGU16457.1 hypothetical protei|eukprot:XP_019330681.1 hypothetical protein CAALFM_C108830CA [Candida albicans SC5314]